MAATGDWPRIWRCSGCGQIVHPADERAAAASCSRCGGVTAAVPDGGPPDGT
jgi:predicted RNA-binding Zn-ribbon protein involved in translation (DUF1610 family)